ncbi:hypothetical protein [Kitasatospora sp. NPDC058190]|uniref:hypothetical protein n=1 Tax=Kitasatospora sp. NPDC058190 TaxID=3346371 RepID=UPI0036DEE5C2
MRKTRIIIGTTAIAAALALSSTTAEAVSNPPGGGGAYRGFSLSKGDTLYPGDYIQRLNGDGTHYLILEMQPDGNLVEYVSQDNTGGGPWKACWATGTNNSGADHAAYQQDGNFVVYTPGNFPAWASNTQGGAGSTVDINGTGQIFVGVKQLTGDCNWG